jgi:hypothetical protein
LIVSSTSGGARKERSCVNGSIVSPVMVFTTGKGTLQTGENLCSANAGRRARVAGNKINRVDRVAWNCSVDGALQVTESIHAILGRFAALVAGAGGNAAFPGIRLQISIIAAKAILAARHSIGPTINSEWT